MNYVKSLLISNLGILKNLADFFQSLTLIDVIFFFSVILLMILVVVLIYFIKLNEDEIEETKEEIKQEEPVKEEMVVKESKYSDEEEGELLDLASITKALENKEVETIDLTAFEEEQERDAIISYDELINKAKTGAINYKSENMYDDLSVKEVDLENIINEQQSVLEKSTEEPIVLSYSQEEAFLSALKALQKQIN